MYTTLRKLVFILFILGIFSSVNSYAKQKTTVTRIIDGDILQALYGEREKRIRLIGIDTPESRVNKKAKRDSNMREQDIKKIIEMGRKAKEYVDGLVKRGDLITIEFDAQERDKHGRLLCYVFLSNGRMLNEEILKAGYAVILTIPPNVKYKEILLKAYEQAKDRKVGLWEK